MNFPPLEIYVKSRKKRVGVLGGGSINSAFGMRKRKRKEMRSAKVDGGGGGGGGKGKTMG